MNDKQISEYGVNLIDIPLKNLINTIHEYMSLNINPDMLSDELLEILDSQLVDTFEFIYFLEGKYYRISPSEISLIKGVKYSKSTLIQPKIDYKVEQLNRDAINADYSDWVSLQKTFSHMISESQPDDIRHKINLNAKYLKRDFCNVVNAMELIDELFEALMVIEYFYTKNSNKFIRSDSFIGCYEVPVETKVTLNTMLALWSNSVATELTDYKRKANLVLKPFVRFDVLNVNHQGNMIVSMTNIPIVEYMFAGIYYYC